MRFGRTSATGSFYAGIPPPAGLSGLDDFYTWLWTVLIPIKNVAWRVALGEATSWQGSGCGSAGYVLASRAGGLLIEAGIKELKNLDTRSENAICLLSGFVAGDAASGLTVSMWSQSVIVESLFVHSVALLMVVLLCFCCGGYRAAPMAVFVSGLVLSWDQLHEPQLKTLDRRGDGRSKWRSRQLVTGWAVIYSWATPILLPCRA